MAGAVLLTLAPAGAVAALLGAARAAAARKRVSWLLFAAGSAAALLGQIVWDLRPVLGLGSSGLPALEYILFLLFYPFFMLGAVLGLRSLRLRASALEAGLDSLLIVAAAVVVALRLDLRPIVAVAAVRGDVLPMLAGPLLALGSLCLGGVLLVSRDARLPSRAVAALLGAVGLFAVGNVLALAGFDPAPERPGDALDLVWLAGWALLAVAGIEGIRHPQEEYAGEVASKAADRLRRGVVPGMALFLAAIAIDAALRPTAGGETAAALGVLGVLLAVRIGVALAAADREAAGRRQLAYSRALVDLSRALASATGLDGTLRMVAQWTCQLVDAPAAAIELLSEDGTWLEIRAGSGLPDSAVGRRYALADSFTGWVVRNGRARVTDDPTRDPLVSVESRRLVRWRCVAAVPLLHRSGPLGALWCARDRAFVPAELELLQALADQAAIAIENARLFEQVRALSLTDPLTGLANRRQLERDLAREFAAARRGRKVVAVLFDLDDLKRYNDRHGHLAGDEALRVFGRILGSETRAMNLAARYGGDEFVVLMSDADRAGAETFVQRICDRYPPAVAALGRGPLTVSAGIAEYNASMRTPDDLIAAADRNLYQAKGRKPST